MSGQETYGEPVCEGFEHLFRGRRLWAEQSPFQRVEVFEHEHFGRMLTLDGLVQTTERDEFCYHEMLVHPALASRQRLARVLVVGGGDGGALRHVLMHGPEEAVMCEIDEAVVRASRAHLPSVSAGAFDDPRTRLVFEDGAAYVRRHQEAFDAIVVDSTDPVGPAAVLFSAAFYAACRRALRPGGVVVTQSGSPFYQLAELESAVRNMAAAFPTVEVYAGCVPTYPGVLWCYTCGTDGVPVSACEPGELDARLRTRGIEARYYTPALHASAFALPAFVRDAVDRARAAAQTASLPGR